jgi:hypothetical protein
MARVRQPEGPDRSRREALKSIGRFAAYVAPAMVVLVSGARAHHKPGHPIPPGHGGRPPGQCNQDPTLSGC